MVHNTELAETILARFSQASDPERSCCTGLANTIPLSLGKDYDP